MFHAQQVLHSELGTEAQGSEMSRALLAQTPGITRSSTGLKGTEIQPGKSLSVEGAVRTQIQRNSEQSGVSCDSLSSTKLLIILIKFFIFSKPLLYSFFSLLSIKPKQFWGKNK